MAPDTLANHALWSFSDAQSPVFPAVYSGKLMIELNEGLTAEEGLEVGALHFGDCVSRYTNPKFKLAWALGEKRVTVGSRVLPSPPPGSFNLTLSATVTHRPRGNTKAPRPTENPNWWLS